MFNIEENLKKLPEAPGVYMHKSKSGDVIYVGKAINLRNRVRQYFRSQKNMPRKVRSMVSQIEEFDYIKCGSEMEALVLECNLIKRYRPKYNILLRDDKTYPYIKISINENYPVLTKTRILAKDGAKYYGPYPDAGAVNAIVDLLNDVYRLKQCSTVRFANDFRPCLNYDINKCMGICAGEVSREEYSANVKKAMNFLAGDERELIALLNERMKNFSEKLEFEQAARCRDLIESAKALSAQQRVVISSDKDMDILIPLRAERGFVVVLFSVREGKLVERDLHHMYGGISENDKYNDGEIVSEFIKRYYTEIGSVPKEILLAEPVSDKKLLEEYLMQMRGGRVDISVPGRGEKRRLLELAENDAAEISKGIDTRIRVKQEKKNELAAAIAALIRSYYDDESRAGSEKAEYRVEAYDISNMGDLDIVGGMVVYEGFHPRKKDYRKFKIQHNPGQDDYAAMREVIRRRITRLDNKDKGFDMAPDLILIDGGKGHVNAVLEIMERANADIPVFGMVKNDFHRTEGLICIVPDTGEYLEIPLKENRLLYQYIGRIQEETHRFAIMYHRELRDGGIKSVLDEIDGIGPRRRNALLARFGSIDGIVQADLSEILKVPGMNKRAAAALCKYFKK